MRGDMLAREKSGGEKSPVFKGTVIEQKVRAHARARSAPRACCGSFRAPSAECRLSVVGSGPPRKRQAEGVCADPIAFHRPLAVVTAAHAVTLMATDED